MENTILSIFSILVFGNVFAQNDIEILGDFSREENYQVEIYNSEPIGQDSLIGVLVIERGKIIEERKILPAGNELIKMKYKDNKLMTKQIFEDNLWRRTYQHVYFEDDSLHLIRINNSADTSVIERVYFSDGKKKTIEREMFNTRILFAYLGDSLVREDYFDENDNKVCSKIIKMKGQDVIEEQYRCEDGTRIVNEYYYTEDNSIRLKMTSAEFEEGSEIVSKIFLYNQLGRLCETVKVSDNSENVYRQYYNWKIVD